MPRTVRSSNPGTGRRRRTPSAAPARRTIASHHPSRYLLTYDIGCDRRRARMAKLMMNHGERLQKSVYEAYLTPRALERLLRLAARWVHPDDSLRVYPLPPAPENETDSRKQPELGLQQTRDSLVLL